MNMEINDLNDGGDQVSGCMDDMGEMEQNYTLCTNVLMSTFFPFLHVLGCKARWGGVVRAPCIVSCIAWWENVPVKGLRTYKSVSNQESTKTMKL